MISRLKSAKVAERACRPKRFSPFCFLWKTGNRIIYIENTDNSCKFQLMYFNIHKNLHMPIKNVL